MKTSHQNHELALEHDSGIHETRASGIVNSRERTYKGGRILPSATRFRYWRTTEGLSLSEIAGKLEKKAREFGINDRYLLTRLMELEQGRYKAPTWLILLLSDAFGIRFPWWEFWDGGK